MKVKGIRFAILTDRFESESGRLVIRAQDERGRVLNISVPPEFRGDAARIWGGNLVPYHYRGGRAFFCPWPPRSYYYYYGDQ